MISYKDVLGCIVPCMLLKIIQENKRIYGYEILKQLQVCYGGKVEIKDSFIYSHLVKLEKEGLVSPDTISVGGMKRTYYTILPAGEEYLFQQCAGILGFLSISLEILKEKDTADLV
jgi:PadR family transcriptional regulator, regulatory protein PadR